MEGLEQVWDVHGKKTIHLVILSAKYGLLRESEVIKPYNCTFQGLRKREISERSSHLQIHEKTEALVRRYHLVFFLLGKEYVQALNLRRNVSDKVTQIFLLGSSYEDLIPNSPNAHFIPCGKNLSYISKNARILKGLVFRRLCKIVCC